MAIRARISSPCELDAVGATFTVCLGSFGFGPMLRLREGAFRGALDGRILSTGALDGRIRETGALDGRTLTTGALDGIILAGSGWLLNSLGSTSISACISSSLGDACRPTDAGCIAAMRVSFFAIAISMGERDRGIRVDAGAGACDCNVASAEGGSRAAMRFL